MLLSYRCYVSLDDGLDESLSNLFTSSLATAAIPTQCRSAIISPRQHCFLHRLLNRLILLYTEGFLDLIAQKESAMMSLAYRWYRLPGGLDEPSTKLFANYLECLPTWLPNASALSLQSCYFLKKPWCTRWPKVTFLIMTRPLTRTNHRFCFGEN